MTPQEIAKLPESAQALIGKEIEYTKCGPDNERKTILGKVIEARLSPARLSKRDCPEKSIPGYQFKIKPLNGGRAFWSDTMAQKAK